MKPLFVLEEPQYHRLGRTVRGAVLAVDGDPIREVEIWRDGVKIDTASVDKPCAEFAPLPFANAGTSRFECDLELDENALYEVRAANESLFVIDTSFAREHEALHAKIEKLPQPPAGLVNTTQGGTNVRSYMDSAVSGFFSLQRLAGDARSILDIGCGTGRLLIGWHADDPSRRIVGADINAELIAWSEQNLEGEWHLSNVRPPLPFEDESFDLIQLASVFTHLPLDVQKEWVREIRRLTRRRAVISLHGEIYARVLLGSEQRQQYAREGYVEVAGAAPGANAFATFHTRAFAEELFGEFATIDFFERGSDAQPPRLTSIAAFQDVYVLGK